jgi:hypothetical protein
LPVDHAIRLALWGYQTDFKLQVNPTQHIEFERPVQRRDVLAQWRNIRFGVTALAIWCLGRSRHAVVKLILNLVFLRESFEEPGNYLQGQALTLKEGYYQFMPR